MQDTGLCRSITSTGNNPIFLLVSPSTSQCQKKNVIFITYTFLGSDSTRKMFKIRAGLKVGWQVIRKVTEQSSLRKDRIQLEGTITAEAGLLLSMLSARITQKWQGWQNLGIGREKRWVPHQGERERQGSWVWEQTSLEYQRTSISCLKYKSKWSTKEKEHCRAEWVTKLHRRISSPSIKWLFP